MDRFAIWMQVLVAVAAVFGAIAAVFKWLSSRNKRGVTVRAGRDVNYVNKSFNRFFSRK